MGLENYFTALRNLGYFRGRYFSLTKCAATAFFKGLSTLKHNLQLQLILASTWKSNRKLGC